MHSELERLFHTLVTRVCKDNVWPVDGILPHKIFDKTENLLSPENIIIGDEISIELKKLKDVDRLNFLYNARKHYIASCKHIMNKSGIQNAFLKHSTNRKITSVRY